MGPKAPTDAKKKTDSFYIMRNKEVNGNPQPDGTYIQFLYMNDGRMINASQIVGSVTDEEILHLLETTDGFRKLVKQIGVTVEATTAKDVNEPVDFYFQMYGKTDPYGCGSTLVINGAADGMERILELSEHSWNGEEDIPGQIRFSFTRSMKARVSVRFFLQEGYTAPPIVDEKEVDTNSAQYKDMISKCIMNQGNAFRIQKILEKVRRKEEVTIAAIGGSITQGAGAVPINTECYARKFYEGFLQLTGADRELVHYIKAGVGGTPSELGMIRYETDVLDDGRIEPDLMIVEFAVNDAGDETNGVCYESLVKRILLEEQKPAVLIIYAVFSDDWNLQERLFPVAKAYDLPAVSVKNAVSPQFADPERMFMTRNQFFYDRYHPTNLGHTIMADCLLYVFEKLMKESPAEDVDIEAVVPAIGDAFTDIKLLDRKHLLKDVSIDEGSFYSNDGDKQLVERNMDLTGSPVLPDNWYYPGNATKEAFRPFTMKIFCKALLIVMMDSASVSAGTALVYVDGKQVLRLDPRVIGWTHDNALICLNEKEKEWHQIEVVMEEGAYDKWFSISGFGVV